MTLVGDSDREVLQLYYGAWKTRAWLIEAQVAYDLLRAWLVVQNIDYVKGHQLESGWALRPRFAIYIVFGMVKLNGTHRVNAV